MQIISKHGASLKKPMSDARGFRFLLIILFTDRVAYNLRLATMTCAHAHCLSHIITVEAPDDNGKLPLSSGASNGRGPGFIEPAEPVIATPLVDAPCSI